MYIIIPKTSLTVHKAIKRSSVTRANVFEKPLTLFSMNNMAMFSLPLFVSSKIKLSWISYAES